VALTELSIFYKNRDAVFGVARNYFNRKI